MRKAWLAALVFFANATGLAEKPSAVEQVQIKFRDCAKQACKEMILSKFSNSSEVIEDEMKKMGVKTEDEFYEKSADELVKGLKRYLAVSEEQAKTLLACKFDDAANAFKIEQALKTAQDQNIPLPGIVEHLVNKRQALHGMELEFASRCIVGFIGDEVKEIAKAKEKQKK